MWFHVQMIAPTMARVWMASACVFLASRVTIAPFAHAPTTALVAELVTNLNANAILISWALIAPFAPAKTIALEMAIVITARVSASLAGTERPARSCPARTNAAAMALASMEHASVSLALGATTVLYGFARIIAMAMGAA